MIGANPAEEPFRPQIQQEPAETRMRFLSLRAVAVDHEGSVAGGTGLSVEASYVGRSVEHERSPEDRPHTAWQAWLLLMVAVVPGLARVDLPPGMRTIG